MAQHALTFDIPFTGFAGATFLNCFASTYVFLQHIALGESDYACKQMEGKACDSCGNCGKGGTTPLSVVEQYFFLFDTMCGRSALRCRFDAEPTAVQTEILGGADFYDGVTDDTADFLFGFAGYAYRKLTDPDAFRAAIVAAIDAGKPVIAEVSSGAGRFRVLTGYDGDALLCPDFTNAQHKPEGAPAYGELAALYVIGEKIEPIYTLKDGLSRIVHVMANNQREKLWQGYTEKMGLYTADSLSRVGVAEKKSRMKRVAETMWHTFNCHNFAEVFRHRVLPALQNTAFDSQCAMIGGPCYGYTHDLAWALIGLEGCADWHTHAAGYFGEMVELTLAQIAKNDEKVLDCIRQMLTILG